MADSVLVVNAGSSSVKFSVYDAASGTVAFRGQVDGLGASVGRFVVRDGAGIALAGAACPAGTDHAGAIRQVLDFIAGRPDGGTIMAAGHRVVHGGGDFFAPVEVDERVMAALAALVPLAPLHQPHSLAAIRAVAASLPEIRQVACFDTAFHHTQPWVAQALALPAAITGRGVRRYGFHGLSYEFVAGELRTLDPAAAVGRTLIAHLGNGASMCAIADGRSVATTMGFTPLDGLMMGTRPGLLDPGVVVHLQRALGHTLDDVERLLYHRSGLLGVSDVSADMRTLLASTDPHAAQAVELFCYRAVREAGSLVAALGGLDAIVFTGGIGEHAAPVRARIGAGLAWLGLDLDVAANDGHATRISGAGSRVAAYVVATDEERMILHHTCALLAGTAAPHGAGVP